MRRIKTPRVLTAIVVGACILASVIEGLSGHSVAAAVWFCAAVLVSIDERLSEDKPHE